jgi:hypothetical protein
MGHLTRSHAMDPVARFEAMISEMKLDGRYPTLIELERLAGGGDEGRPTVHARAV